MSLSPELTPFNFVFDPDKQKDSGFFSLTLFNSVSFIHFSVNIKWILIKNNLVHLGGGFL